MYVPEAEEVADLLLGGLRGNVLNVDGSHCCGNAKVVEMFVCGDVCVWRVGIEEWWMESGEGR